MKLLPALLVFFLSVTAANADHSYKQAWKRATIILQDRTSPEVSPLVAEYVAIYNAGMHRFHIHYIRQEDKIGDCPFPEESGVSRWCSAPSSPLHYTWIEHKKGQTLRQKSLIRLEGHVQDRPNISRFVICHEMGHMMGLGHREYGSDSCLIPEARSEEGNPTLPDDHDFSSINSKKKEKKHGHKQ